MRTIPFRLPSAYHLLPGHAVQAPDVDAGGYDVLIGGHGFRLATDPQNQYQLVTEPTTIRRFDNSIEPGEQSLSALPWSRAQASFHAGAGQLNLEQGTTAFQYQQEQVEHIRYDTSLGIDPWTPGKLKRLPDTQLYNFGFDSSCTVSGMVGGVDYAIIGGVGSLQQVSWPAGPDAAPTVAGIDLTPALYGGAANVTVQSLTTDGLSYYALLNLAIDGSVASTKTYIVTGSLASTAAPTAIYKATTALAGTIGWVKARLMAGLANSLYELPVSPASPPAALPTAKYTHPSTLWQWTALSWSPVAVLAAGQAGGQSSILSFLLDTSGVVPTLAGGATVAVLPPGELIYSLGSMLGSFLGIGTSNGIRVGTFDTYTGSLKYGPLAVVTTKPVFSMTGRDRFIYASFTNQQADGTTGLVAIDLSMVVDAGGRNAYAPSLRPPTSAPTGIGNVTAVTLLPKSARLLFISPDGIHVEGPGPGSNGAAWLRTSRIRYNTGEMKLFKSGHVHGQLDLGTVQVTGITPYNSDQNLGTFGFIPDVDIGEFGLPSGLHEWLQLKLDLSANAVLNGYHVKAFPAPNRQHLIILTLLCFDSEADRWGTTSREPESARQRFQNLVDLEERGDETRFVEFTNTGPKAQVVLIDQLAFQSPHRPSIESDFGGLVTVKLRKTD